VSIGEVKNGDVDVIDLMKLNALMDMRQSMEHRAIERAKAESK